MDSSIWQIGRLYEAIRAGRGGGGGSAVGVAVRVCLSEERVFVWRACVWKVSATLQPLSAAAENRNIRFAILASLVYCAAVSSLVGRFYRLQSWKGRNEMFYLTTHSIHFFTVIRRRIKSWMSCTHKHTHAYKHACILLSNHSHKHTHHDHHHHHQMFPSSKITWNPNPTFSSKQL